MRESIAISARAAGDLQRLLEQSQRASDRLNIYVEALGAALDVPNGWRFDTQQMGFVPPTSQAPTAQVESAQIDAVEE